MNLKGINRDMGIKSVLFMYQGLVEPKRNKQRHGDQVSVVYVPTRFRRLPDTSGFGCGISTQ